MKPPKPLYLKIAAYCDYQERCTHEVWEKMKELEVPSEFKTIIFEQLGKEGILNDERFAIAYARGRFRFKKWGRIKIKYNLKQKMLPLKYIAAALDQLDEEEYQSTLDALIEKKISVDKLKNNVLHRSKLYRYMIAKGFEQELLIAGIDKFLK